MRYCVLETPEPPSVGVSVIVAVPKYDEVVFELVTGAVVSILTVALLVDSTLPATSSAAQFTVLVPSAATEMPDV